MDGFLVVRRCGSDDLPIGLYSTFDEAIEHVTDEPGDEIIEQFSACRDNDPVCAVVVRFVNGEPEPIEFKMLWDEAGEPEVIYEVDGVPKRVPLSKMAV